MKRVDVIVETGGFESISIQLLIWVKKIGTNVKIEQLHKTSLLRSARDLEFLEA